MDLVRRGLGTPRNDSVTELSKSKLNLGLFLDARSAAQGAVGTGLLHTSAEKKKKKKKTHFLFDPRRPAALVLKRRAETELIRRPLRQKG